MVLRESSAEIIEEKQLPTNNTAATLSEIDLDRQEMHETETPTERQERRFEAEVASNSKTQKKSFGKKFIRSLIYEISWSIWFLFAFAVFQPKCKCKDKQYYKFVTNNFQSLAEKQF